MLNYLLRHIRMDFYRDRICIVLETMHGFSVGTAPSESQEIEIGRPLQYTLMSVR